MPTLAWLLLVAPGAVDKEIGWVPEGAVLLPTGEFYCLLGDFYCLGDFYRTQADDCLLEHKTFGLAINCDYFSTVFTSDHPFTV